MSEFRYIAIFGNGLYILWILFNAIDEGFRSIHTLQAVALVGLIILLTINIYLLLRFE